MVIDAEKTAPAAVSPDSDDAGGLMLCLIACLILRGHYVR